MRFLDFFLLLSGLFTLSSSVPATTEATKAYPYSYSAVGITGGGFTSGFVAHPTAKDVIYVRTDIGSTYRWNAQTELWVPITDFISRADANYFGTESFALDPTDANRIYLAQGQLLAVNHSAFFVRLILGEHRSPC